jgi:hypothetical protein
LCLAVGAGLGVVFAFDRAIGAVLRPLHVELNLWGWLTLLIYGMGYHILPQFAGQPLRRPHLADAQSWLAIIGVLVVVFGWIGTFVELEAARLLLFAGGLLQAAAALLFAGVIGELLIDSSRSGD